MINYLKEIVGEQIHTQNLEKLWCDLKGCVKWQDIRSKYMARYLFISSTENKRLLHHFIIEVANLYPPLSDRECLVHCEEESDLGFGYVDDMKEPQPGSTFL